MFKNLDVRALGVSGTQSQIIESALSFGFKGIHLDMVEFAAEVKSQGLAKARRLLDSARLKVGSFRLPLDWSADDAEFNQQLEQIGSLAALAKELSCTRAVTVLDPSSDTQPYHQNFEQHRRRLGLLARKLGEHGVRLGVGIDAAADAGTNRAFEFIRSFDALLMLLAMVSEKNLGALVDVWDVHSSGSSLEAVRKLTVEKIVAVRLADSAAAASAPWPSNDRLLPQAQGKLDNVALLQLLADMGYDGPITPAPSPGQFAGKRRDDIVKQAGQSLDEVWKAAGLSPAGKRLAAAPARR
ncbi:MAG TPA: TIM barrel protein [Pirellulales bacterium]|jgi:sugar phosphate isomerase/epimerase|nr:TIM barrel protein [Pirellulales bacterium]